MSYNKESKEVFIEKYTELLAEELYLHDKYFKENNESIERIMNSTLHAGWNLSDKEKINVTKNAVAIVNEKYGLKLSI